MLAVDPILRGAAIGILMVLGWGLWRARPRSLVGALGPANALCLGAYLLWAWPQSQVLGKPAQLALMILALCEPFLFWLLVGHVFSDRFRWRARHLLWLGLTLPPGLLVLAGRGLVPGGILTASHWLLRLSAVTIVLQALWCIQRDWRADLVEPRRRLRWPLLAMGLSLSALLMLGAALYANAPARPPSLRFAEALLFLVMALVLAGQSAWLPDLVRPSPDAAQGPGMRPAGDVAAVPGPAGPAGEEAPLLAALDTALRDGIWREAGLTIGALAQRLGVPEYRLRRLINQTLGHRNFNSFLNDHRLAGAAAMLADPRHRRLPVLTIALDHGFGSIGPFNRAFRARYGMTPTDYRRQGGNVRLDEVS